LRVFEVQAAAARPWHDGIGEHGEHDVEVDGQRLAVLVVLWAHGLPRPLVDLLGVGDQRGAAHTQRHEQHAALIGFLKDGLGGELMVERQQPGSWPDSYR
jgi:hypothetical protein